mmetsp:Transcript_19930/g.39129  ORF Transcript_19930/g.39129 Transcript_19930/m.39129 type:complete len:90 (+) Transcript_19930:156-425(+)
MASLNEAGAPRGSSRDDEYYRELLARVDNAIVETRDDSDGSCNPATMCRSCVAKTVSGALIGAAIVTECLISVKLLFTSDSTQVPSGQQ